MPVWPVLRKPMVNRFRRDTPTAVYSSLVFINGDVSPIFFYKALKLGYGVLEELG